MIAAIESAIHFEQTGEWRLPHEQAPPDLVPLEQVTGGPDRRDWWNVGRGWSKACSAPFEAADPDRKAHHPERALFGGWRIDDWRKAGKR